MNLFLWYTAIPTPFFWFNCSPLTFLWQSLGQDLMKKDDTPSTSKDELELQSLSVAKDDENKLKKYANRSRANTTSGQEKPQVQRGRSDSNAFKVRSLLVSISIFLFSFSFFLFFFLDSITTPPLVSKRSETWSQSGPRQRTDRYWNYSTLPRRRGRQEPSAKKLDRSDYLLSDKKASLAYFWLHPKVSLLSNDNNDNNHNKKKKKS